MSSSTPMSLDNVMNQIGPFGWYQLQLLLTTELSYLICTGSLLSANYLTIPAKGICLDGSLDVGGRLGTDDSLVVLRGGGWIESADYELLKSNYSTDLCGCEHSVMVRDRAFYSLFMHLRVFCSVKRLQLGLALATMIGGVMGAIGFGFLGDRYGRKRMCLISLSILILADFAYAGAFHIGYAVFISLIIGVACGGVMTGNLAFLMECVGPDYRLLCAALNGWPLGMMTMALTGYATQHWRYFLIFTACLGIPFWVLFFFAYESPRWLVQHNRIQDAQDIFEGIAKRNKSSAPTESQLQGPDTISAGGQGALEDRNYSYIDLTRDKTVLKNLIALFYSWFASAVISYGVYFTLGSLSGNLFLNLFLLGLFKGTTGIIPYFASRPPFNIGRKPILCCFVTIACISVWVVIILFYVVGKEAKNASYITALTVLGAAAIDPIWKVNHLYSAELFPTVVRSMARGVCNVGSRTGSALSPVMAYIGALYFVSPYWVFGLLAICHVLVAYFVIPETKGKPLPERLSSDSKDPAAFASLEQRYKDYNMSETLPQTDDRYAVDPPT